MDTAMVTGRMAADKKQRGNAVLGRNGINSSQAINLMYDRLLADQNADFLTPEKSRPTQAEWARAAHIVDGISKSTASRFDSMTRAEIKVDRLRSRGLM